MSVTIDWGALGMVFFVSFGSAVGVIVLFTLGVSALAERNCAPSQAGQKVTEPRWARPVATLCFLGCALVVAYGLSLIIK